MTSTRTVLASAGVALVATLFLLAPSCCAGGGLETDAPREAVVEAVPPPEAAAVPAGVGADDVGGPPPRSLQASPGAGPGPAAARPPDRRPPSMTDAEWEEARARALKESAARYEKFALWCVEKKLPFTAVGVHRLVLRYLPDDTAARADTGDVRGPDGHWARDESRRTAIRGMSDVEDPRAQKYPERRMQADKFVSSLWKKLAQQAKKSAEIEPQRAADWTARAARAWERVLEVDSAHSAMNDEAHKALGHPKFNGRYCRPEAVAYLRVRDERRQAGTKRANASHAVEPADVDGVFAAAGLGGAGARSAHCVVNTVHGADVAARACVWAERAIADFTAVYGTEPGAASPATPAKFNLVQDKAELKRLLMADGLTDAEAERFPKSWGGGHFPAGEATMTFSGGADADEFVLHYTGHRLAETLRAAAIRDGGSPGERMEDWLRDGISYDVSRRLTQTTIALPGGFTGPWRDIDPNPAQDLWIELAKRLVEADEDVALSRLWKLSTDNRDFDRPAMVKGWALLQFLFEEDAAKARTFVRTALAHGTPKAVETVYDVSLDEIDARYRKWLRVSW